MTSASRLLQVAAASVCILLSSSPGSGNDQTFQEHEESAKRAEKAGDLKEALSHFTAACRTQTSPVLEVMRHGYCSEAVELAAKLDSLEEIAGPFERDCSGGSKYGCYTLAWVEEKRGNLGRAVALMGTLCSEGFAWPPVEGDQACDERSRLKEAWITTDPGAAKQDAAITLLAMVVPLGVVLLFRQRAICVTLARMVGWLVAAPYLLLLLARISAWFWALAFLPLSFYFLAPALLFCEPHFMVAIGAGPTDAIGMLLGAGFYLDVACVLTLILHGFRVLRRPREAQA